MAKEKPNVFPKTIKNKFEEYSEEEDLNQFIPVNQSKSKVAVKQPQKQQSQIESGEESEYATKQEMKELFSTIMMVQSAVTNLAGKFGTFQNNISTQIVELNARVALLEETTKIIKDNL